MRQQRLLPSDILREYIREMSEAFRRWEKTASFLPVTSQSFVAEAKARRTPALPCAPPKSSATVAPTAAPTAAAMEPNPMPSPPSPPVKCEAPTIPHKDEAKAPDWALDRQADGRGLLYYEKYWFLSEVAVNVQGELLCGIPASLHDNVMRLVDSQHSYYIPLHKISYIRTPDGLDSSFEDT